CDPLSNLRQNPARPATPQRRRAWEYSADRSVSWKPTKRVPRFEAEDRHSSFLPETGHGAQLPGLTHLDSFDRVPSVVYDSKNQIWLRRTGAGRSVTQHTSTVSAQRLPCWLRGRVSGGPVRRCGDKRMVARSRGDYHLVRGSGRGRDCRWNTRPVPPDQNHLSRCWGFPAHLLK